MSRLMILAASVFEILCGKTETNRREYSVPVNAVSAGNKNPKNATQQN